MQGRQCAIYGRDSFLARINFGLRDRLDYKKIEFEVNGKKGEYARSRSGCYFCFFQQKIEWVRLAENHPDRFAEAVDYEKTALRDGSPFTWSQGESLTELIEPKRVDQIKIDYEKRRDRLRQRRRINPLSANTSETIDDVYGIDEASGGCVICHK